jgi:hypothetical protein
LFIQVQIFNLKVIPILFFSIKKFFLSNQLNHLSMFYIHFNHLFIILHHNHFQKYLNESFNTKNKFKKKIYIVLRKLNKNRRLKMLI